MPSKTTVGKKHQIKILIVEDEKPIIHAMVLKLDTLGFSVSVAEDGEKALQILRKEDFDLVLLDLMIPKVGGFEVMAELKKMKKTMPVLITSNLGQESDISKAIKIGAVGYLVKSRATLNEMIDYIKKILASKKK